MIPNELKQFTDQFFKDNSKKFELSTNEGCGLYTEAYVVYAQANNWTKVGHLKKNSGQTNYNGHANDAFLYAEYVDGLYQAVDIIGSAEAKPPYTSDNPAPSANFGIDIPRYTAADWYLIEGSTSMVPWVQYNEQGFQSLKNMLAHDYARKPQGADFDVSVWAGRYFHNCYMGPDGTPLGEQAALERIKPELCSALGISNDGYYGS